MIMLCTIDWTAIGSIASAIMAFLTLVIIYQNMQARMGVLVIDIVKDQGCIWLTMSNIGETLIDDIRFTFDNKIKKLASGGLAQHIELIEYQRYALKPHETKRVQLETIALVRTFEKQDKKVKDYFTQLYTTKIKIEYDYRTIYKWRKKAYNTFIISPEKLLFTTFEVPIKQQEQN